jgi:ABC-type multidrug transport system ATPase subunit
MEDLAVETFELTKEFRGRVAVHSLDLAVPRGVVFGFLGPNGAGKTTTIRMMLGLARPSRGTIRILGQAVPRDIGSIRHRIGSVLERPAFYPHLTARLNLLLLAHLAGDSGAALRIDDLLETVGLKERADDTVRSYSEGMRQRLGLAAALLHNPDVVVLDEPANGLDPGGIRDVRALLNSLRDQGRTIFLSSHLLSEVERLCDSICLMNLGKPIYKGAVADLTHATEFVRVQITELDKAESLFLDRGWQVYREGGDVCVVNVPPREVNRVLAEEGLFADEIRLESQSLEKVFLQMTEAPPTVA